MVCRFYLYSCKLKASCYGSNTNILAKLFPMALILAHGDDGYVTIIF